MVSDTSGKKRVSPPGQENRILLETQLDRRFDKLLQEYSLRPLEISAAASSRLVSFGMLGHSFTVEEVQTSLMRVRAIATESTGIMPGSGRPDNKPLFRNMSGTPLSKANAQNK